MELKIILPFEIILEKKEVTRLVVETTEGFFGFLPNRLDCVAFLVPGIIIYQAAGEEEKYAATHMGILVKTGPLVSIAVRNGILGTNVAELQSRVQEEFLKSGSGEQEFARTLKKLESVFLHGVIEEVHRG